MPERELAWVMPLNDRVRAEQLSGAVPEMALFIEKEDYGKRI